MRKIVVMGAAIMAASASYALNDKQEKFCQSVSSLSEIVMKKRQEGVDITKAMNVVKGEKNPEIKEFLQQVIISAYEKPRFNLSSNKAEAVMDYKNETYVSCIRSLP